MRYRFPATFPASILIGMVIFYTLRFIMEAVSRGTGEHGPELSFIIFYIALIGGAAALLMGVAAALMTLLAGRQRRVWFALWPILIYGGMILAFSIDIRGFAKELTIISALFLIPGLVVGDMTAFRYWCHHQISSEADARQS